jgi:hypothetical protein
MLSHTQYVFLLVQLTLLVHPSWCSGQEDEFVPGSVVNKVVPLGHNNFKQAIEDPANPLWLLKFYAPWYVQQFLCATICLYFDASSL